MNGIGRRAFAFIVAAVALGGPAYGAVERLEITARVPFAGGAPFADVGPYEKIVGRLHYAVDPDDPANALVVDLKFAPRDERGLVTFAGDFMLLRPVTPARGNRRLLYEVGNRGNIGLLSFFNDAPRTNRPRDRADAGNGFLFRKGYSLLWSAWNWDVTEGQGRMQIALPVAREGGRDITGRVAAEITVNWPSRCEPLAWGDSRGYAPAPGTVESAVLSVRAHQTAPRRPVPRARWRLGCAPRGNAELSPTHLYLADGFRPGLLYELVYTARAPRVVGLGLAAIRDALSFFRFAPRDRAGTPNPIAGTTDFAIIFGISQSGRVIQHMLYQGFHLDEAGRRVFDGAMIHVAGAGKGSFNHRFAQTTRHPSPHEDHQYPADFFPFTTVPETDPVTGAMGDVLARAKRAGAVPKLFYTATSTEYWTRAASLLHSDVEGRTDAGVDSHARVYMFAGAQHGMWAFPTRAFYQSCVNPLDHRPPMRALLGHLDRWISDGTPPPDSIYPRLDRGTLGSVEAWRAAFPAIPGLRLPTRNLAPPRLDLGPRWASDGIIDRVPPPFGPPYRTRVPLPGGDGIDRGGLRLPAVAAPLGTYLGWNLRHLSSATGDLLGRWSGSFIPFPVDERARRAQGDPRRSIEARYGGRAGYLAAVRKAARRLAAQGWLLDEDLPRVMARAGAFYDRILARAPGVDSCAYTVPDS